MIINDDLRFRRQLIAMIHTDNPALLNGHGCISKNGRAVIAKATAKHRAPISCPVLRTRHAVVAVGGDGEGRVDSEG